MTLENLPKKHATWPQLIKKEVANTAVAEFCDSIGLDKLQESCCAVCSGLYPQDKWKIVSLEEINLSLLKAPTNLTAPTFEIDFHYGHSCIDGNELKVLLD